MHDRLPGMSIGPTSSKAWAWGIALLTGLVLAFLVAFWLATTLLSAGLLPGSTDAGLRWDLAFLNATMGITGLAAVMAVARAVFGSWPRVSALALMVALVGIGLAIAQELALHEWARVHVGQYEFDHVFPTALLSWATIGVAVTAFAALVAPRAAVLPPSIGLWLAAGWVWLVTLSNVPGALDGIEPESWLLAILIGMSAVYAAACLVASARSRRITLAA